MSEAIKGKPRREIEEIRKQFLEYIKGAQQMDKALPGELQVLARTRKFPARIKCATLPWRALKAALKNGSGGK